LAGGEHISTSLQVKYLLERIIGILTLAKRAKFQVQSFFRKDFWNPDFDKKNQIPAPVLLERIFEILAFETMQNTRF
jgi:hypothetical protein